MINCIFYILDLTEFVVLSQTAENDKMTVGGYLVSLFRIFGVHRNERETILSQEDQTIALQLCLAQINKEVFNLNFNCLISI